MPPSDRIEIIGLRVPCLIGVYPQERRKKQWLILDLSFPCDAKKAAKRDKVEDAVDYHRIAEETRRFVAQSRTHLIETLAEELAAHLLGSGLKSLTLRISKPGALRGTVNVALTLTRNIR